MKEIYYGKIRVEVNSTEKVKDIIKKKGVYALVVYQIQDGNYTLSKIIKKGIPDCIWDETK